MQISWHRITSLEAVGQRGDIGEKFKRKQTNFEIQFDMGMDVIKILKLNFNEPSLEEIRKNILTFQQGVIIWHTQCNGHTAPRLNHASRRVGSCSLAMNSELRRSEV